MKWQNYNCHNPHPLKLPKMPAGIMPPGIFVFRNPIIKILNDPGQVLK
jgi:hypothetical protein